MYLLCNLTCEGKEGTSVQGAQLAKLYLTRCREEMSRWAHPFGASPPLQHNWLLSCSPTVCFLRLCKLGSTDKAQVIEGRIFFSQSKLSAPYARICICLMISISVIERAVKKHRERDGEYQGY